MHNPLLFLEYTDILPTDFDLIVARICFINIQNLFSRGLKVITPVEVDQEVEKYAGSCLTYKQEHGLEFLTDSYEVAEPHNFEYYYKRIKKYSLLRRLKKEKYDISEFYIEDKDIDDPLKAVAIQDRFENASVVDILNSVEKNYSLIRNEYLAGGHMKGNPAEGLKQLVEKLRTQPQVGVSLEGTVFSSVCRGARLGCFYLKSSSSGSGKTRTSIFDACHIAYPERWSEEKNTFVKEKEKEPQKVLFIVTEMDKEELQTIMLAYLSGVDEAHIITGSYAAEELERVNYAVSIIDRYSEYFIIEEISEPNLTNVEATIKKYALMDEVKYVFFDYIHSTASMINQFARSNIREDVVLMLMANQLKQLAKDYNVFIFSATQVNMGAMSNDDGEFKNETNIRSSKAIVDKADVGYVMSRISDKFWNSVMGDLRKAAREGLIDATKLEDKNRPTHVLDIYKMRQGRYKNVRIWTRIHLGTGYRKDLFMTTSENQPIPGTIELFLSPGEDEITDWKDKI